jgi:hypothetical protein
MTREAGWRTGRFTMCYTILFPHTKPERHKERDCHRSDELMQGICFFFNETLFLYTGELSQHTSYLH